MDNVFTPYWNFCVTLLPMVSFSHKISGWRQILLRWSVWLSTCSVALYSTSGIQNSIGTLLFLCGSTFSQFLVFSFIKLWTQSMGNKQEGREAHRLWVNFSIMAVTPSRSFQYSLHLHMVSGAVHAGKQMFCYLVLQSHSSRVSGRSTTLENSGLILGTLASQNSYLQK